ncbi:MAG: molecular chaperone TorD family protein [Gammaproteobacteria bacterium]|nr:molecular chaperone TorD family protein [Gammaproteobacteria bacterium]
MLDLFALLLGAPDGGSLPVLRYLADDHPWLEPAVAELAGVSLEQWQAEHTRLFVNGYPKTPCVPFESHFRHGRMGGAACRELSQLYAGAGVAPTDELPPDYLGTMLSFAAWLQRDGGPAYQPFLEELEQTHLSRWLPEFCSALIANAHLELYRLLGEKLQNALDYRQ